jgi:hypothetical protein
MADPAPAPAPGTSGDIMQKGTADEAHFQVEAKTELVNRARVELKKIREIRRFLNDLIRSPALQINDENDFRGRPTMMTKNADIIDSARFMDQRLAQTSPDGLLLTMESNLQRAVNATNPTRAKMTGIIGTQYGLPGATTSTVTSFGQPKTFNAPGGPTALISDFVGLNTKPAGFGNAPLGPRPDGVRGSMGRGRNRRRRTRRRSAH